MQSLRNRPPKRTKPGTEGGEPRIRTRQGAPTGALPVFATETAVRKRLSSTSTIDEPGQPGAIFGRLAALPDDWRGGTDSTMRTYLVTAERHPKPRPRGLVDSKH